jgi:hypothetical protein
MFLNLLLIRNFFQTERFIDYINIYWFIILMRIVFHEEGKGWQPTWKHNEAFFEVSQADSTNNIDIHCRERFLLYSNRSSWLLSSKLGRSSQRQLFSNLATETGGTYLWESWRPLNLWKFSRGTCNIYKLAKTYLTMEGNKTSPTIWG